MSAEAPAAVSFACRINGIERRFTTAPQRMLADLLREDCALTGTKIGCDQGVCGACTVLIDGVPMAACTTFAWQAEDKSIITIEGLAADGVLHPVQQAFKARSAFQCGFCTPGMILLGKALLDRDPAPERATIRAWIGANICRCTGYQMILEAIEEAARQMREGAT
jgi:carbon-monoxide dehydrogenase small subunit